MIVRVVVALMGLWCLGNSVFADEPTFEQLADAKRIGRDVARAAELLESGDASQATGYWLRAHERVGEFLSNADAAQRQVLAKDVERMRTLQPALIAKGVALPALPEIKPADAVEQPVPPPTAVNSTAPPVAAEVGDFAVKVAPMLVTKCGRCHIDARRGRLSIATINELLQNSELIVPGKPEESELVAIIESGAMPKGRTKVTAEELQHLRIWIQSGADFGNADRAKNLKQIASSVATIQASPMNEAVAPMVTDSEVVSFSNHIAPLLVDSCADCHMDAQRVRGGLNLGTLASLMRGGDSGAIIRPNQGEQSLLVKKLRGTGGGQQMPAGGPPLSEDAIQAIVRWIDQGANFDGGNQNASLRDVIARAATAKATHEELTQQRAARAAANWQLVMSGKTPVVFESETFIVLTPGETSKPKDFSEVAESVASRVANQLRISAKEPFVKGKIAAYVFAVRYDYGEFGKMIEKRDLPREWTNHWGNNQVDAYIVFQAQPNDYGLLKPFLARNIAAAYLKGLAADMPDWFANGFGYSVAAKAYAGEDVIKLWKQKSAELTEKMPNRDDFVTGRMSDDDAGLVAFQFVEYLKQNGGSRVNKMISEMRTGTGFERAFVLAFDMTPSEFLNQQ